jgi:hypothetical protein
VGGFITEKKGIRIFYLKLPGNDQGRVKMRKAINRVITTQYPGDAKATMKQYFKPARLKHGNVCRVAILFDCRASSIITLELSPKSISPRSRCRWMTISLQVRDINSPLTPRSTYRRANLLRNSSFESGLNEEDTENEA